MWVTSCERNSALIAKSSPVVSLVFLPVRYLFSVIPYPLVDEVG
jgi:hypothetical protein